MPVDDKAARRMVAWTLALVTLLFLVSGFGITSSDIVTPISLGVFGKSFSYVIHTYLWGPFIILFLLHIYLNTRKGLCK
jgi:cytochrome b subunit of formate dehydrogenase